MAKTLSIRQLLDCGHTLLGENLRGLARLEHSYIDEYFLDADLDPNLTNDEVNLSQVHLQRDTERSRFSEDETPENVTDD